MPEVGKVTSNYVMILTFCLSEASLHSGKKRREKEQKIEIKIMIIIIKIGGANGDEPSPGLLFIGRRLNVPVVSILQ